MAGWSAGAGGAVIDACGGCGMADQIKLVGCDDGWVMGYIVDECEE